MLCVVSGQTVVHWESSNASMMTLPRNWLSDIGWPNWFCSRKSGADRAPREVPRSRLGLSIAAEPGPPDCDPPDCDPPGCELADVPVLHPARPGNPPRTPSRATADSAARTRNLFIARTAYCRTFATSQPATAVCRISRPDHRGLSDSPRVAPSGSAV